MSADGDRLYVGEYGNALKVHDFDTEREIELGGGGTYAFSPDGKQVVLINKANKQQKYVVCDVETTRRLITLLEVQGDRQLGPVDWRSDGKRIAGVTGDNELCIWTLRAVPEPASGCLVAFGSLGKCSFVNLSMLSLATKSPNSPNRGGPILPRV